MRRYQELGGLEQQKFIVLENKSLESRGWQGHALSESPSGASFLVSFQLWWSQSLSFLGLQTYHSASIVTRYSPCMPEVCSSYKDPNHWSNIV